MAHYYVNMLDELLSDGESRDSTPSPSPSVDNQQANLLDYIKYYQVNRQNTQAYQNGTMIQSRSSSNQYQVGLRREPPPPQPKYSSTQVRNLLAKAANQYVHDVAADRCIVRSGRMNNLRHDQSIIHLLTVNDLLSNIRK